MLVLHSYGIPDISEYQNSGTTNKDCFYLLIWLKEAIQSAGRLKPCYSVTRSIALHITFRIRHILLYIIK